MKSKLIQYPEEIHEILVKYKEQTGMSVNAFIQEAITKKLIHDKLLTIKRTTIYYNDKTGEIVDKKEDKFKKINQAPEAIKYCDGDKCQVEFVGEQKE